MLLLEFVGCLLLRYAERQLFALLFHEPPRRFIGQFLLLAVLLAQAALSKKIGTKISARSADGCVQQEELLRSDERRPVLHS